MSALVETKSGTRPRFEGERDLPPEVGPIADEMSAAMMEAALAVAERHAHRIGPKRLAMAATEATRLMLHTFAAAEASNG